MANATQIKAALTAIRAVADAIRDAGQIPSGHLYAALMPHGITIHGYDSLINMLVNSGVVRKSGDMLIWNIK